MEEFGIISYNQFYYFITLIQFLLSLQLLLVIKIHFICFEYQLKYKWSRYPTLHSRDLCRLALSIWQRLRQALYTVSLAQNQPASHRKPPENIQIQKVNKYPYCLINQYSVFYIFENSLTLPNIWHVFYLKPHQIQIRFK